VISHSVAEELLATEVFEVQLSNSISLLPSNLLNPLNPKMIIVKSYRWINWGCGRWNILSKVTGCQSGMLEHIVTQPVPQAFHPATQLNILYIIIELFLNPYLWGNWFLNM
jgi:hypothetical protein